MLGESSGSTGREGAAAGLSWMYWEPWMSWEEWQCWQCHTTSVVPRGRARLLTLLCIHAGPLEAVTGGSVPPVLQDICLLTPAVVSRMSSTRLVHLCMCRLVDTGVLLPTLLAFVIQLFEDGDMGVSSSVSHKTMKSANCPQWLILELVRSAVMRLVATLGHLLA